jgi:hypothetical protein
MNVGAPVHGHSSGSDLRYPKTYLRPLGRFVMVSHRREASIPQVLLNGFETRRITYRYFLGCVSGPLADPYRKELGPPLGLPDNSSTEMSCSSPIEGSMTFSPLPPREEATKGRTNQKSRHPSVVLSLHTKAQGLPSQNYAEGFNESTEDQIGPITPAVVENKSPRRSQLLLRGLGGYTRRVRSCAPIGSKTYRTSEKYSIPTRK